MQTIDAIYTNGKFEPLTPVTLAENERVKLTVEQTANAAAPQQWLAETLEHLKRMEAKYGTLPDSTPDIAADRRRDG